MCEQGPSILTMRVCTHVVMCACSCVSARMCSCVHAQGVLSRGLQHSSPLVLAGSLSLMQRALAALQQQLLLPIEEVAAAAAAVVVQQHHSSPLPDQQLQAQAAPLLQQHSAQVQQDYQQLLSLQQQEQPQRVHSDAVTPVQTSQHADVLRAVASGWCSLLHSLRLSLRHKLPDISVLVAVITSLQRSSAAAAPDGSGPSTAGKASAAGPKQHPQQQQPCYCDRSQAQWLLPQAYSVLAAYARWMPEAVADGHVDLGKLLLQGQGQVSSRVLYVCCWRLCGVLNPRQGCVLVSCSGQHGDSALSPEASWPGGFSV